jgi:hypothetical protein
MHGIQVHTATGEEFLERTALGWSFGMKRKIDPLNLYIEVLSQFFNTPGTEVAPWSDKICEDLQLDRFVCHAFQYGSRLENFREPVLRTAVSPSFFEEWNWSSPCLPFIALKEGL